MKGTRQAEILRIIAEMEIETQEQLLEELSVRGFKPLRPPSPETSSSCML